MLHHWTSFPVRQTQRQFGAAPPTATSLQAVRYMAPGTPRPSVGPKQHNHPPPTPPPPPQILGTTFGDLSDHGTTERMPEREPAVATKRIIVVYACSQMVGVRCPGMQPTC
mmetsp:Transcript_116759/g.203107  ORF Transcript_116759/g.203107 Transcript_116759/m.203107 type:complete len:111 (+) Transcript_116759:443-775(+)